MLNATVGQLFVNEALPEDLRDYDRVLDNKELKRVLREVAERYPDKYREVSFALNKLGRDGAQESGSFSFGLRHLKRPSSAKHSQSRVKAKMRAILSRDDLTDKKRNELIVRAVGAEMQPQQEAILAEAIEAENPLAYQVSSGTRGNRMNLASLLGSDLLYSDQRDQPLPIPVTSSYSEGLSPAEYWAGSYGARKGLIALKFATQDAGFLAKQLNQVAHRLVVSDKDMSDEGQRGVKRGMPVDVDDADNEGSLLAMDTGPYEKNTVITPKVRKHLKRLGNKRILVRSPLVGGSPSGGVYARDVGVRETGRLPGRGTQVGLQAAQALSEPLSQGQMSAKHSGGVTGSEKAVSGFQYINQLIQVPKTFKGGAAHSTEDGTVQRIEDAPAGGKNVTINDKQHYVAPGYDINIKKGDSVEAGDVISEGFPNPALVTRYKGVGDGRKYFVQAFKEAMQNANLPAHRRNVELLSRGLINHVRLTEEYGDNVPDDVIPYSTLEHKWQPREGHKNVKPRQGVGKYLEQPVLHYTIGTKVRPSMLKELKSFGVDEISVHDNPPPFEPEMVRGMSNLQHDPDWMTRFYGSGLKKSLLSGAQRGAVSDELGTSFVPSISRSVDFGRTPGALVKQPEESDPLKVHGDVKVAADDPTRIYPPSNTKSTKANNVVKPPPKRSVFDNFLNTPVKDIFQKPKTRLGGFSSDFLNSMGSSSPAVTPKSKDIVEKTNTVTTPPQPAVPLPKPIPPPSEVGSSQSLHQTQEPLSDQYSNADLDIPPTQPVEQNQITQSPKPPPGAVGPPPTPAPTPGEGGNTFSSFGNEVSRLGVSGGVAKGLQRFSPAFNSAVEAAKQAPKVPFPKRVVPGAFKMMLPGSRIGTTAATAAGVGGVGAIAPAVGAFSAVNALVELGDAAGLLPQWAGGTGFLAPKAWGGSGVDAFGWDQSGFNKNVSGGSYLGNTWRGAMNPLKSSTNIVQGVGELGGRALGGIRDYATGTTADTRRNEKYRSQLNRYAKEQDQNLYNLKDTGADQQQIAQAEAELQQTRHRANRMVDETSDWKYGKNFKNSIQDLRNQARDDSQREVLDQISNAYGDEVWWGGSGDMAKRMRSAMQGTEHAIDQISRYAPEDKKPDSEAYKLLQHNQSRLEMFRKLDEMLKSTQHRSLAASRVPF